MIKLLSVSALFLASTAAFAQTTSAEVSAQPDTTPVAVAATVDIAAFDLDRDGGLNAIEYAQWWASTQAPAGGVPNAGLTAEMSNRADDGGVTELLNQTAAAFLKADANDDNRVTPDEAAAPAL
jgi:hypothetical protein